jgi:Carboxypeptidase regulatory-like domain
VTVILMVLSAASVVAHEFRTSIRGHVLDSSKGALSGVTVTAPEHRNQRVAPAVSNAEGNYTIPFLRPGSYTLTGTLLGAGSFLISIYGEAPRTSFAL